MNAIILACHNKIDDLMLHLEVLKYYTFPFKTIIIHTMDYDINYMKEIKEYPNRRIEGYGHFISPLLCLAEGLRLAKELDCEYVVYRNADDILYNSSWEKENFKTMKNYLCGGYSWLNVGVNYDITLNQVYLHVPSFYKTITDAENYFKNSSQRFLPEHKLPRWIKKTCNFEKDFYRLPGREQEPGIGWERKEIPSIFRSKQMRVPFGFWEKLENNNRYFNSEWQLIGCHNIGDRLFYWEKIKHLIPYAKQHEKDHHFRRLSHAVQNNLPWNLPNPL